MSSSNLRSLEFSRTKSDQAGYQCELGNKESDRSRGRGRGIFRSNRSNEPGDKGDSGENVGGNRAPGGFGRPPMGRGKNRDVFTNSNQAPGLKGSISKTPSASPITSAPASKPKVEFMRQSWKLHQIVNGTVIQAKSPSEFWITTARGSGFSSFPDIMWDYGKKGLFVPLMEARSDASCIVLVEPPAGDQFPIYARAIITKMYGDNCDLWLIDYAEAKKSQPIVKLFDAPAKFADLPFQAVKCKLYQANEFRFQFEEEEKRKAFISGIVEKDVVATVKANDAEGVAVVEIRFGIELRDLRDVCKEIASGNLNAFE